MKLIALTGGIGAGKSTVSAELSRLGVCVIDSDKVSRYLMEPGQKSYDAVVGEFGIDILNEDKTLNRRALGDIVFSDKEKLEKLNSITHPLIYDELKKRAEESDADIVCLEIPLLFDTDCPIEFDLKIAVTSPEEIRVERVMKRDNCTADQARARIANQLCDDELERLSDYVIVNDGDVDAVIEKTGKLYKMLEGKAGI